MLRKELLALLHDDAIALDKRIERVIHNKTIPTTVLLHFACDCAERALDLERQASREPERVSFEAIRLVQSWLEKRARGEEPPAPEKPDPNSLFSSLAAADAILKQRFSLEGQLATIALEAREAVDLWEAKAPALAATAAAIVAEMAVKIIAAENDAERDHKREEHWTDAELDSAMKAGAARGNSGWASKSELDTSNIVNRLFKRRMDAATHAADEVSRMAAERAAQVALDEYERNVSAKQGSSLGKWIRSLWGSKETTPNTNTPQNQQTEIVESARVAEREWQITRLGELLPPDP